MRYITPVYFQTIKVGAYNQETGDYAPDTVDEVQQHASVTETGVEALRMIYGTIRQGSYVVRLQRPYNSAFDQIRIGDKCYRVDRTNLYHRVFVVSEVQ